MDFQGFIKTSLIDYPDKVSSVAFVSGCNFKCGFCHNGDLVNGTTDKIIPASDILEHLEKRLGIIDGLVISGGEPTLNPGLLEVLRAFRLLRIPVKLDTNGSMPDVIEEIIKHNLVSYIAMDIKADEEHYNQVACVEVDFEKIKKSIDLIMNSGIDYEFRTTILKALHNQTIMKNILSLIKGAKKYVMQQYIENKAQIKAMDYGLVTLSELFEMKDYLEGLHLVEHVDIRGKY